MQRDSAMFPVPTDAASSGATHVQWLAGVAMHALIMRMEGVPNSQPQREEIALWSYRMAQTMREMESRIHVNE